MVKEIIFFAKIYCGNQGPGLHPAKVAGSDGKTIQPQLFLCLVEFTLQPALKWLLLLPPQQRKVGTGKISHLGLIVQK